MASQGLAVLVAAASFLDRDRAPWRPAAAAFLGVLCYEAGCVFGRLDGTFVLQPAGLPIVAWPALLPACARRGGGAGAKVAGGAALVLAGGLVIVAFDNRCGGTSCISELAPWEHRPCLAATTALASCPFPEAWNHAAYMHLCCVAGVLLATAGFCDAAARAKAK